MADLKMLIENVRNALDELEAGLETGEEVPMEVEEPEEGIEMRRGMRPKKSATMTDYFSNKKM